MEDGLRLTLEQLESDPELAEVFAEASLPAPSVSDQSVLSRGPAAARQVPQPAPDCAYVAVSQDGMVARLVLPGGASRYTAADITMAIEQAGVTYGVDATGLAELLGGRSETKLVSIARGNPPVSGSDASIDYMFPTQFDPRVARSDGIDWEAATLIHMVEPGTPLARRKPAVAGKAGVTVRGEEISPRPVRDVPLEPGPGTAIADGDPNLLLAAVAGAARLGSDGRVAVVDVHVVKGQVERSIDFDGSVQIRGDVQRGFTVRATSDVEITGLMANARVIAGGSILIRGGVLAGISTPSLQAADDVIARSADRALVRAGRDIVVREVVNCDIEAEGSVLVEQEQPAHGFIRGGSVRAARQIVVHTVGAPASKERTQLRVGHDWLDPARGGPMEADLRRRRAQLDGVRARLAELSESDSEDGLAAKLRLAGDLLRREVGWLERRLQAWQQTLTAKRRVAIFGVAYPPIEVVVDGVTATLGTECQSRVFMARGPEVVALPLGG